MSMKLQERSFRFKSLKAQVNDPRKHLLDGFSDFLWFFNDREN